MNWNKWRVYSWILVILTIVHSAHLTHPLRHSPQTVHYHKRRSAAPNSIEITIAALIPSSDKYLFSQSELKPAADLAKDHVSKAKLLAPWVHLNTLYRDSACSDSHGMNEAISFYVSDQVSVFFGPICDYALAPIARQAKFWNLPMVSVGALALGFRKERRNVYPVLTRAGPVNVLTLAHAVVTISKNFGWKQIKVFYQTNFKEETFPEQCKFAVEPIIESKSEIKQDYYRLDPESNDWDQILRNEIGNTFSGMESSTCSLLNDA